MSVTVPPDEADIAALTDRMRRGDEAAWSRFYDLYFQRLLRYLLVVTQGREDTAREALQQTLTRAAKHMRRFESEAALWGWLTVLARSCFVDETRKGRRYFAFLERFFAHQQPAAPSLQNAEDELGTHLQAELGNLPPEEREIVERKYFGEQSVRDIAAELQTTEKAVESRLLRARRRLKEAVLGRLQHEAIPGD